MNIYLVILIIILIGLYLGAFMLRRRKWFSNLFLVAAAVLFILLVSEFVYRVFLKGPEPVIKAECDNCFQHDSLLGFKPAAPGHWKILSTFKNDTIANTSYTIIPDSLHTGLVYDHRAGYKTNSDTEYVFLGCSFTFGARIADSATLPYQFGKLKNASTVNLGCEAYGLYQVCELFKNKYAAQDNHHRVFVYSLLSDHFFRAAGVYDWNLASPPNLRVAATHLRAPYYLSFFGSLHLVQDKLSDIMLRNRMKLFTRQHYDQLFSLLREMNNTITQTGGKLIILNWDRSNWGYQGYEFPFQQQLDNDVRNFTSFNVSGILNYNDTSNFIQYDGHPTYAANERIAGFLFSKLR